MNGRRVAVSWSGGKDSCLALHRCLAQGAAPATLLTIFDEPLQRSRSHGLRPEVVRAQAECMGLPLRVAGASWATYEVTFRAQLAALRDEGVHDIVFGDIDLPAHREWEERVCAEAGVRAHLPLWLGDRRALLAEFWAAGFICHVIAVDARCLDASVLGAELTPDLVDSFVARGIDACGENGEFHTVVVAGPCFRRSLPLVFGEVVMSGGCLAIDATLM
jgi:uncharacterized protein (TIGR00290 family)